MTSHVMLICSDGIPTEEKAAAVLAGIVVDVADIDAAVALAAEHPIARHHVLEVRPFQLG